jgi:acetoacetyl-CoA synthetase
MNTALPVFSGQLQCRMLGMAVNSFTPTGQAAPRGMAGELVCTRPFPCQPLGFWPLPGFGYKIDLIEQAKEKYQESYFKQWEGVWCKFTISTDRRQITYD